MKTKIFYVVVVMFVAGCYEYMPPGISAQIKAQDYLDSLYRPDSIGIQIGMGYITLKDYAMPIKRKEFQQDSDINRVSKIDWADFTRKTNDIVAKGKDRSKGSIVILNYQVRHIEHTTAFFIDSSFRKVLDTIEMK